MCRSIIDLKDQPCIGDSIFSFQQNIQLAQHVCAYINSFIIHEEQVPAKLVQNEIRYSSNVDLDIDSLSRLVFMYGYGGLLPPYTHNDVLV